MRKLIYTALLFITLANLAVGQGFNVSNPNPSGTGGLFSPSIEARTRIKNNSNSTQILRWTRVSVSAPNQWETAVCDEQCYSPDVTTHTLTLFPRQERDLRVVFYPRASFGTGNVQLVVFNPLDSANTATLVNFDAANNVLGTGDPKPQKTINIFPNPPIEYFQLEDNNVVSRIEVYNMVGVRVAQYVVNAQGEHYPVGELPRGLYLVRLLDRSGNILFTQRISKYNP